jgi:ankyrin repeat protein
MVLEKKEGMGQELQDADDLSNNSSLSNSDDYNETSNVDSLSDDSYFELDDVLITSPLDQNSAMDVNQVAQLLNRVRISDSTTQSENFYKNRDDIVVQYDDNNSGEDSTPTTVESTSIETDFENGEDLPEGLGDDPIKVLSEILKQNGFDEARSSSIAAEDVADDFFLKMTEENTLSYTSDVIAAVRNQDIESLERLQSTGTNLQCCNNFGESILHMACRRGFTDVVNYLLSKGGISPQIRDDYGRTPMHDAFWSATPNFELVQMLMKKCPDLLLICDVRGQSCLSYAQKTHRPQWCRFLWKNKELINPTSVF